MMREIPLIDTVVIAVLFCLIVCLMMWYIDTVVNSRRLFYHDADKALQKLRDEDDT